MKAEIGIFGGSGFYKLLEGAKGIEIETEYGKPSDRITIGKYEEKTIAFLPRHGKNHEFGPKQINYRANIAAFKKLGVERIIAPCTAGSLTPKIKPGDFVILDQFVDRTWGRADSFFEEKVVHISAADPYCPELREVAYKTAKKLGIRVHQKGTVVVINGPRFSSRAESRWFSSQGFEVINMTQYPEVILAREMGICYCGIALITDYDVGLEGMEDIYPVTAKEVMRVFKDNNERVKRLIFEIIKNIPKERHCECGEALKKAQV